MEPKLCHVLHGDKAGLNARAGIGITLFRQFFEMLFPFFIWSSGRRDSSAVVKVNTEGNSILLWNYISQDDHLPAPDPVYRP